jgi:hypothetical protein
MTEDEQTIERIEAQIFERYQQSGTDYLVDYLEGEQSAIDLNFYPAHERAALINLASDLTLARRILSETKSRSYELIWRENKSRFASARKPPRDALKSIVADILLRHIAAATDEIALALEGEIEALARDRLADLRAQLESGGES